MTRKERVDAVVKLFKKYNPDAETELAYENPYQLLVAVILSAQCTDERINKVTPALFKHFPAPEHLAASSFDEVFPYIKSVTYPNNKTRHLIGMAKMLVNDFKGVVPAEISELQKLPGVGRKTANVISSVVYNQPAMAVDTHVFRVSKRLGLVNQSCKTPLEIEKQLVKYIATEDLAIAHHWLILHGRYVCSARKPKCEECRLTHLCRYFEKNVLN
jgi:endonuclease-3